MVKAKIPPKYDALTKAIIQQDEHSSSMKDFEQEMRRKYLLMFPLDIMAELSTPILPAKSSRPPIPLASGEASPSYLIYGEVPERMKRVAPHAKFLVLVRDPVERAYSHYNMTRDPVGSPFVKKIRGTHVLGDRTFEDVVDEDMKNLKACHAACGLRRPVADRCMESYMRGLPDGHGAHCYVGRGLFAMQLKHWFRYFDRSQFLVVSTEALRTPEGCQRQMDRVFEFLELPRFTLPDTTPKNTAKQRGRKPEPMADKTRRKLREFFEPHNKELFDLIGQTLDWQ